MINDPAQSPVLTTDVVRKVFAEIAVTLNFVHGQSILYRDLKLENILFDGQGHIRIIDFGIARKLEPDQPDCNFSRICSAQDFGSADPKSDHFEPKSGQNDPGLGLKYLEIDPKSASGGSQTTLILCHLGRKSFAPNVSHLGSFHGSPSGISAHFSGRPAHFCGARFRLCWP